MKNNLVVVMISVAEHKTGIYYGSQWGTALDSAYLTIQTDSMNPRFRDGDLTGGMTAGLDALRQVIKNQLHPQSIAPRQIDLQNPDRPALSELEYRQMATAALRLAGTLDEQLGELRNLLNSASELLTGAQQKITAATSQAAAVVATGLLVPSAEPLLSEARTLVSQAVAAQGAQ
jgi:hypothetical protein